jgi:hypothetical protein
MGPHNSKPQVDTTQIDTTITRIDTTMPSDVTRARAAKAAAAEDKKKKAAAAAKAAKDTAKPKRGRNKASDDRSTKSVKTTPTSSPGHTSDEEDEESIGENTRKDVMIATLKSQAEDMEAQIEGKDEEIEKLRNRLKTRIVKETNRRKTRVLPASLIGKRGMLRVTNKALFRTCPFKPLGWSQWSNEQYSFSSRILSGMGLEGEESELRALWNDSIRLCVSDFDRKARGDALKKLFREYTRECHEGSV